MTVKLLTEQHLEFLSLKGGSIGSYESTLVKMAHSWKSHVAAQLYDLGAQKNLQLVFLFEYSFKNNQIRPLI